MSFIVLQIYLPTPIEIRAYEIVSYHYEVYSVKTLLAHVTLLTETDVEIIWKI